MTSLAATSLSQMVTHPSINQAQSSLTSVIRLWMVTPCQQGPNNIYVLHVHAYINILHQYICIYTYIHLYVWTVKLL